MLFNESDTARLMQIHVVGSWDPGTNAGYYEASLTRDGESTYYTAIQPNTTPNRSMIQGLIDVIRQVNEPTTFDIYSPAPLGEKKKKSPNADLIRKLVSVLDAGQHNYNFLVEDGRATDMRGFIRKAKGFAQPQKTLPELKTPAPAPEAGWSIYVLNPVDSGWDYPASVEETKTKIERQADQGYSPEKFDQHFQLAKGMAASAGMTSDIQQASVFWVPGETQFNYGFVLKERDNGTTYVISPLPMPALTTICIHPESHLKGTPRQIQYAKDLIVQIHTHLDHAASRLPELSDAIEALKEVLESVQDSRWIITNRQEMNLLVLRHRVDHTFFLSPGSVIANPLISATPPHLSERVQPLLNYVNNQGRLKIGDLELSDNS